MLTLQELMILLIHLFMRFLITLVADDDVIVFSVVELTPPPIPIVDLLTSISYEHVSSSDLRAASVSQFSSDSLDESREMVHSTFQVGGPSCQSSSYQGARLRRSTIFSRV